MARRRSARSGFEQRLLASLRAAGVRTGERLTVGFSGGPDSLALASALAEVRPKLELEIRLVHVDHRLRPESSRDSASCAGLASELGLEFRSVALQEGLRERTAGIGLEEAARRERFLALATAASVWQSSTILLGHQANDQAETLLMRLFRGTGIDGLSGMAPRDERMIPWWPSNEPPIGSFAIVRPMLRESRASIESYLGSAGLAPIVDDTNASTELDRNLVRHVVLPPILERWPAAIESMGRLADTARADSDALEQLVDTSYADALTCGRTFRTDTLPLLHPALARRMIRRWLTSLGLEDVGADVVARCYELARAGDEDVVVEVGNGVSVVLADSALATLDALIEQAISAWPLEGRSVDRPWTLSLGEAPSNRGSSAFLAVPTGSVCHVRPLRDADRWWGSERSVFEDVRAAGIHPQLRTRLLAYVLDEGVLLIPAIYPTIRAGSIQGRDVKWMEVRWWRSS